MIRAAGALALLGWFAIGLSACFSTPPRPGGVSPKIQPAAGPPPSPSAVPDAVPRIEPRARDGNPPFYDVFGKRYFVLSASQGFVERGVASWYGPGFHKVRTSSGEPYDMYGMSAAHKTLPLPAYVHVKNLQNGRSVVVRVNDRGPFVGNRIIDLSYTAAAKLDMLRAGTAMVEIRAIDPAAPAPVLAEAPAQAAAPPEFVADAATTDAATADAASTGAASTGAALFVQAGAFADPKNAERLAVKLRGGGYGYVFVRDDKIAGRRLFRVRIGPVPGVAEFDRIVAAMEGFGIRDAHLALE